MEHRRYIFAITLSSTGRPRIFGIGLDKTGTSSLHRALRILGYRSFHWGGPGPQRAVLRAIDEGKPLLHYLHPKIDAFTNVVSISQRFRVADAQYPGSRFILTVRELDGWLDSRRRHVERNRQRKAAGEYRGNFLDIEIDTWRDAYLGHETAVLAYFASRPEDLLILDIADGDGWEPLCRFLDRRVPAARFPWENRYRPYTG